MQKIVSAITSGDVPDLISHDIADQAIVPQNAWDDKMVEVSDVVETQKDSILIRRSISRSQYYNNATKKRGAYFIPYKTARAAVPHLELAGREGRLQDGRRAEDLGRVLGFLQADAGEIARNGMRNVYSMGLQCTTTGPADGNNMFNHFLIANGGNGIVTKDGKAASR